MRCCDISFLVSVLNPEWWFGVAGRKRHEGEIGAHRTCARGRSRRMSAVGTRQLAISSLARLLPAVVRDGNSGGGAAAAAGSTRVTSGVAAERGMAAAGGGDSSSRQQQPLLGRFDGQPVSQLCWRTLITASFATAAAAAAAAVAASAIRGSRCAARTQTQGCR